MLLLYTCSPDVPVVSGCDYECLVEHCVTATLKQAESSRSRQNQAIEPGQDGPYQCLRTRAQNRIQAWIKNQDSTRKLPGKPGLQADFWDARTGEKTLQ